MLSDFIVDSSINNSENRSKPEQLPQIESKSILRPEVKIDKGMITKILVQIIKKSQPKVSVTRIEVQR